MDFFWSCLSAFVLGFLGGAHCIGMCGGIMAALSFAIPNASQSRRFVILLAYNIGRIGSYMIIAALAATVLSFSSGHGLSVLRVIAGLLLLAMGLYLGNWWQGLTYLERGGSFIWRYIQPLGKRFMPVSNIPQALILGAIWGWLPCGLIYSALVFSAAQSASNDGVLSAAIIMLAFGLGTLPAVLASGFLAERIKQWIQNRRIRTLFALLIMLFGSWTIYATLQHANAEHHHAEHRELPAQDMPMHHQHHHH